MRSHFAVPLSRASSLRSALHAPGQRHRDTASADMGVEPKASTPVPIAITANQDRDRDHRNYRVQHPARRFACPNPQIFTGLSSSDPEHCSTSDVKDYRTPGNVVLSIGGAALIAGVVMIAVDVSKRKKARAGKPVGKPRVRAVGLGVAF